MTARVWLFYWTERKGDRKKAFTEPESHSFSGISYSLSVKYNPLTISVKIHSAVFSLIIHTFPLIKSCGPRYEVVAVSFIVDRLLCCFLYLLLLAGFFLFTHSFTLFFCRSISRLSAVDSCVYHPFYTISLNLIHSGNFPFTWNDLHTEHSAFELFVCPFIICCTIYIQHFCEQWTGGRRWWVGPGAMQDK